MVNMDKLIVLPLVFRFALTHNTPPLHGHPGRLPRAGLYNVRRGGRRSRPALQMLTLPLKRARYHMQRIRFFRPLAMVMGCLGIVLSTAQAATRTSLDLNSGWQFRQRMAATATPAEWRPATVPGTYTSICWLTS